MVVLNLSKVVDSYLVVLGLPVVVLPVHCFKVVLGWFWGPRWSSSVSEWCRWFQVGSRSFSAALSGSRS